MRTSARLPRETVRPVDGSWRGPTPPPFRSSDSRSHSTISLPLSQQHPAVTGRTPAGHAFVDPSRLPAPGPCRACHGNGIGDSNPVPSSLHLPAPVPSARCLDELTAKGMGRRRKGFPSTSLKVVSEIRSARTCSATVWKRAAFSLGVATWHGPALRTGENFETAWTACLAVVQATVPKRSGVSATRAIPQNGSAEAQATRTTTMWGQSSPRRAEPQGRRCQTAGQIR